MSGLIQRVKSAIPIANAAPGKVIEGVDIVDGLLYLKDEAGNVTKFATSTSVAAAIAAALADYDLSTIVDSKISTAIDNLIDGAPATLDTLNELAAAIDDDENFATTVMAALSNKADKIITINAGSGLVGGGDLSANRTISMPDVVTAGSSSSANSTLGVTVDVKGRITSFTRTLISITAAQVSDFANTVRATVLTGIDFGSNAAVLATDTVLQALGKLQAQINSILSRTFQDWFGYGFQEFTNNVAIVGTSWQVAYSNNFGSKPAGKYMVMVLTEAIVGDYNVMVV